MERLMRSWNKCKIFKLQILLPAIIMICLGYAIKAHKATEAIEWEKGDAGKKERHPMTSEKTNVIKTSLILRSTEEILDANIFCEANFHLRTETKI